MELKQNRKQKRKPKRENPKEKHNIYCAGVSEIRYNKTMPVFRTGN